MTESSPTEQTNALLAAVVASSMDAFSASIRAQEFRHGTRPLSNSTATQRPKRLVSLLAFSLPIPRTMRQGLGSSAYFKASRFISKRLVDAKMEVWSRLGSALGQFGTRVDT